MNASEDDKIKAMMDQSTKDFDQSKYVCLRVFYFSSSFCLCHVSSILCQQFTCLIVNVGQQCDESNVQTAINAMNVCLA